MMLRSTSLVGARRFGGGFLPVSARERLWVAAGARRAVALCRHQPARGARSWGVSRRRQAELLSDLAGCDAVGDSQLAHEVRDVNLCSLLADEQVGRDLPVGVA